MFAKKQGGGREWDLDLVSMHLPVFRQNAVHHISVSLLVLVQALEQSKGQLLARKVRDGPARPLKPLQLAT